MVSGMTGLPKVSIEGIAAVRSFALPLEIMEPPVAVAAGLAPSRLAQMAHGSVPGVLAPTAPIYSTPLPSSTTHAWPAALLGASVLCGASSAYGTVSGKGTGAGDGTIGQALYYFFSDLSVWGWIGVGGGVVVGIGAFLLVCFSFAGILGEDIPDPVEKRPRRGGSTPPSPQPTKPKQSKGADASVEQPAATASRSALQTTVSPAKLRRKQRRAEARKTAAPVAAPTISPKRLQQTTPPPAPKPWFTTVQKDPLPMYRLPVHSPDDDRDDIYRPVPRVARRNLLPPLRQGGALASVAPRSPRSVDEDLALAAGGQPVDRVRSAEGFAAVMARGRRATSYTIAYSVDDGWEVRVPTEHALPNGTRLVRHTDGERVVGMGHIVIDPDKKEIVYDGKGDDGSTETTTKGIRGVPSHIVAHGAGLGLVESYLVSLVPQDWTLRRVPLAKLVAGSVSPARRVASPAPASVLAYDEEVIAARQAAEAARDREAARRRAVDTSFRAVALNRQPSRGQWDHVQPSESGRSPGYDEFGRKQATPASEPVRIAVATPASTKTPSWREVTDANGGLWYEVRDAASLKDLVRHKRSMRFFFAIVETAGQQLLRLTQSRETGYHYIEDARLVTTGEINLIGQIGSFAVEVFSNEPARLRDFFETQWRMDKSDIQASDDGLFFNV